MTKIIDMEKLSIKRKLVWSSVALFVTVFSFLTCEMLIDMYEGTVEKILSVLLMVFVALSVVLFGMIIKYGRELKGE